MKRMPPLLLLLALVACGGASPTPTMALLPALAAEPLPTAPPLAAPPANGKSYSDPALGLSFIYPADWQILPRAADAPPGVSLHGPGVGTGPEPIIFAITVDVESVSDAQVGTVVDGQLSQVPAELQATIQRRSLTVAGAPAEQVIGLPSQAGAVETFVLRHGQVYLILLQPYDEHNQSLLPYLSQARRSYEGLLSSLQFQ